MLADIVSVELIKSFSLSKAIFLGIVMEMILMVQYLHLMILQTTQRPHIMMEKTKLNGGEEPNHTQRPAHKNMI